MTQKSISGFGEDILSSLRAVDAPAITKEEFERLYQGKLTQVIDLVAHNIVGRTEASAARLSIQRHRETCDQRTYAHAECNWDPLYANVRRAESRLKTARIASENTHKLHTEKMQVLRTLENEVSELERTLEDKRLTELLLAILERKEKIRLVRSTRIEAMIQQLRQKDANRMNESTVHIAEKLPMNILQKRLPRTEHTRDALAALQAHALRISRLSALAKETNATAHTKEAEQHLLHAIAGSMGSGPEDETVVVSFQQLRAAAHSRAKAHVQYRPSLPISERPAPAKVLNMSQRIDEKEKELETLTDQSAVLIIGCARSLQTITDFAKETSPALRDALQKESASAQRHVDVLRLSVVNRTRRTKILPNRSLSKGQSFLETLKTIERSVIEARENDAFVHQAETLIAPDTPDEGDAILIDTFMKEEGELEEKLRRLLERKGKKTEEGRVLVEGIDRLMSEVALIARARV